MNEEFIEKVYNNLEKNAKGKVVNSHKNILTVFREDVNLNQIVQINEFTQGREIKNQPPWRKKEDKNKMWTDEDESQLFIYFGVHYDITATNRIKEVLNSQFYFNSYNPVKCYLQSVKWDGIERLETLFIDYLGATNNEYVREATKITLIGCVKRIMEPGCKHDTVLVLVGDQGIGKSYILSQLGMEWYNESLQSFKGDEAYIKISSSWIVELSELTALKRSDQDSIKAFISAKEDIYRPKYAKYPIHSSRKCVFFGTTNNMQFLKDETGNRRWLPIQVNKAIRVKNPFDEFDQAIVNQIWAEARFYYEKGEKTYLENQDLLEAARKLQEEHKEDDGLYGMIEEFLKIPITEDWYELRESQRHEYLEKMVYKQADIQLYPRTKVCALEIWKDCLNRKRDMTKRDSAEINQVLRSIPYLEETRTRFGQYGQQRGFIIR